MRVRILFLEIYSRAHQTVFLYFQLKIISRKILVFQ